MTIIKNVALSGHSARWINGMKERKKEVEVDFNKKRRERGGGEGGERVNCILQQQQEPYYITQQMNNLERGGECDERT